MPEHRTQLHEKRAEAIEELDNRAYHLAIDAARYASTLGRGGPEQTGSEMYSQVIDKVFDFDSYRDLHRIYLSDELDRLLYEFVTAVKEPIVAIGVYSDFGGADHQTLRQHSDIILKAVQATSQRVPAVRSALINEFRKILAGQ